MQQTVAVLGGGVGGLSAAHELAERGFKVHVYERKAVMGVRGHYVSHTQPPAATMVGIDRLVEEDLLVEIEAVAVVGDK